MAHCGCDTKDDLHCHGTPPNEPQQTSVVPARNAHTQQIDLSQIGSQFVNA
jgi:hypothetical protein